eukprot:6197036-Pleurochrysis_carterae.AAC.1
MTEQRRSDSRGSSVCAARSQSRLQAVKRGGQNGRRTGREEAANAGSCERYRRPVLSGTSKRRRWKEKHGQVRGGSEATEAEQLITASLAKLFHMSAQLDLS